MPVFDFRFTVDASVDVVSAYHFEPGILKTLTPPLMILQVHQFEPLGEGSISDFTMWMGPVPIRWRAVHSCVSPSGFTDTQVAGPMCSWAHTHSFVAIGENTTEVREHIEYEHFGGLRGLRSRLLFSRIGLLSLFTMRKVITRRELRSRTAQYDVHS